MRVEVADFREIEREFIERVHTMVWCNVATVDRRGRPRSRILHSIWEGSTGWIATRPNSLKASHLVHNPHVSLAYISDVVKPVFVDGVATWVDDLADKQRIWDLFRAAPPPLGYDPAPIFGQVTSPGYGLLKLTPSRIVLGDVSGTGPNRVWQNVSAAETGRLAPNDRSNQLVVEVFVRDMARSKEFYQALGFAVDEDRGDFVVLSWHGFQLFLDEKPNLPPATSTRVNVRIMVDDVDSFWRRAQELNAPIFAPIGDREYGLRDFTVLDPDGFGLRFASPTVTRSSTDT